MDGFCEFQALGTGVLALSPSEHVTRAMPATQYKKRMLNHSWDSPRNSQFDLLKLVLARERSM